MNTAFSFFDKIVCINLERRKDRWAECEQEFQAMDIQVERVRAIAHPQGPYGCALSHLTTIRQNQHLDSLLIFEDDVAKKGDLSYLAEALQSLPAGWEVVYLGGLVFPDEINTDRVAGHVHRAKNVVCTHAYGLSRAGMQRIIREFGTPVSRGSRKPIDEYLRADLQPHGKAFIVTPMIFAQRPSHSDLTGKYSDHDLFTTTNNKFR